MAIYQESKFTRARVFKWNQTLPIPPGAGLLMLLIKNEFISVSITSTTIPEFLMFDLQDLSSRDKMEKLVRNALGGTYQFDQNNIACLAAKISKYLVSNFRFSVETLSRTNVAKTVIVVDICDKKVFLRDQVEGVVKLGDEDHVYDVEDIVCRLRKYLNVPYYVTTKPIASDEPLGLVEVPALKMFATCDGGSVSEEDTCAICLEELLVNQRRSIKKTSCSHVFHGGCLARWLWRKQSCPMCRFQLP